MKRKHNHPNNPNRPEDQNRIALAPYNFIPFPHNGKPILLPDPLPEHDIWYSDRHTGKMTVQMTTRTPIFIRGLLALSEWETVQAMPEHTLNSPKNNPNFFAPDGSPQVPPSSFRGLLREH